jgi:hypothetical protein
MSVLMSHAGYNFEIDCKRRQTMLYLVTQTPKLRVRDVFKTIIVVLEAKSGAHALRQYANQWNHSENFCKPQAEVVALGVPFTR